MMGDSVQFELKHGFKESQMDQEMVDPAVNDKLKQIFCTQYIDHNLYSDSAAKSIETIQMSGAKSQLTQDFSQLPFDPLSDTASLKD